MKKIVVSGSKGFVGTNLSKYLSEFDIAIEPLLRTDFKEKLLPAILEKADAVVHLAGKAHDLRNVDSSEKYFRVNFELTRMLFEQFLLSDAKKFIFISSVKASADKVYGILNEVDVPNPITAYGKSKLRAEEFIQSQILPEGKSYFILRPCMIHGPGNKGNLNLLTKFVFFNIPYPLAAFENKRSFLSIENLCFVICELLERDDIKSGVYNVADDHPLSTNELIQLISKVSDKFPRFWKVPPMLVKLFARIGDFLRLPLTTERLNKLTDDYVVDNSKIKAALGKELPVESRAGIVSTIKSFQYSAK